MDAWQGIREIVPVIGGAMGFVSAWFTWIDRRERKNRERAERTEAVKRKQWCEETKGMLERCGGTIMSVDPARIEWARWGASQGYFAMASNDPVRPYISRG